MVPTHGAGRVNIPPQYDGSHLRGRQGREEDSPQAAIPLSREGFNVANA